MIIFPAIDMKDGKCVRLKQGMFDEVTVFGENPVEMAKKWEEKGGEFLHLVDLDGAKDGVPKNLDIIKEICKNINIPIQLGGGIRNKETVKLLLEAGVNRVILGTVAINNIGLLKELVNEYGEKIVVSIDAKDGLVAVDGWINVSEVKSIDLVKELESIGVKTIVYTDISKDGMMAGPNFEIYKTLQECVNIDVIASGGVSSIEDIRKLKEMNMYGAIVGKALYTGDIELEKALEV
ncbi:1-(5-phosphoribosyl)-5-[(5-phosphoribosylamino)methylideneamino] imidazole-4-carboxamide isomerase HisA [Gottschalkia acidurici 9a]|uniref:1-(5-phosphoribosyl)-5-[(5-phosphoribosylamino)methylideneamino] imidazole-4-carboxamide isomerase n=1 Tax=Gottschalkia acidurici (strain ATCC 7906 / DSM 604 / BCRC 14475 / CIP 104303 / KCTC 5404 / NCIMB 10678 / 9a) TaxID=1128398 RepID=K0B297_GOTA9|nr:1-(5-phosphoribosyl)-5-[(5-phosphoribosylamino)methylideneamino]imidazole-4-carboxamide isomerase [Gottschalkia acidurici]AFS78761.1 1-(5-phosphoribosyl)-5-[(5-phosphoribosylamino)methylideneamino] imidazole-4-carboxamide isomerase HisA [Gottschalkia acidurici 9a]